MSNNPSLRVISVPRRLFSLNRDSLLTLCSDAICHLMLEEILDDLYRDARPWATYLAQVRETSGHHLSPQLVYKTTYQHFRGTKKREWFGTNCLFLPTPRSVVGQMMKGAPRHVRDVITSLDFPKNLRCTRRDRVSWT